MTNSIRRITGIAAPPGRPGMLRASLLRRSPFLLPALALLALAVLYAPGSQDAAAYQDGAQICEVHYDTWQEDLERCYGGV